MKRNYGIQSNAKHHTASIRFNRLLRFSLPGLMLIALYHCGKSNQQVANQISAPAAPILLAIGYDQSGTVRNYPVLATDNLKHYCQAIEKSEFGGLIAIYPIGLPSDSTFLRCTLEPIPNIDPTATLSEKARQQQERERIQDRNTDAIQEFLHKFSARFSIRNHPWTDFNGFGHKAAQLLSEPTYTEYRKYLFLYSDGFADLPGENSLQCDFTGIRKLMVCTAGWKNEATCRSDEAYEFESLKGFSDFFTHQLNL